MQKHLTIFIPYLSTFFALFMLLGCDDRPNSLESTTHSDTSFSQTLDTNTSKNSNNTNQAESNNSTQSDSNNTDKNNSTGIINNSPTKSPIDTTLSGQIDTNTLLTADKIWILQDVVSVTKGATLTIEAGTTIAGKANSYLIIDKNSKIMAEGTATNPIIFTSAKVAIDGSLSASGQWGGLTIIGNAGNPQVEPYECNTAFTASSSNMQDNSGILKHVKILYSGVHISTDKDINGLSLVGVGSKTLIDEITIDFSADDGIEIWGGTVNLSHLNIQNCADDYLDVDDGYSGTISKVIITQNRGYSGIEISGNTSALFQSITLTQESSTQDGAIFFNGDGAGGHFAKSIFKDNTANGYGAIHSLGIADVNQSSFNNVLLTGNSPDDPFTQEENTGGSAQALEDKFDLGTDNLK